MARRTEICFQEILTEHMDDAAFAIDKTGEIKLFNTAAGALFGVSRDVALNKKIWDVIKIQELNRLILDAARNQESSKIEKVVIIGQKIPFLIKIFPAASKSMRRFGAVAIMKNLGEYARIEEALTNYVDDISHELKAPLTAIKGYVETLLDESYFTDPDVNRKFLQIINEETNRMTRMIVSMLDSSRGSETKKDRSSANLVEVSKVLKCAVDLFAGVAIRKNIEMIVDMADNLPYILADEDSLQQIFVNLLDNALKFTGVKKSGKINITAFPDGKVIKVRIVDTGIGISAEHLPFVFDRFYRVTEGDAALLGGTGIGLSIVKKLLDDISGTIKISSELGAGTSVTVIFPAFLKH